MDTRDVETSFHRPIKIRPICCVLIRDIASCTLRKSGYAVSQTVAMNGCDWAPTQQEEPWQTITQVEVNCSLSSFRFVQQKRNTTEKYKARARDSQNTRMAPNNSQKMSMSPSRDFSLANRDSTVGSVEEDDMVLVAAYYNNSFFCQALR